MISVGGAVVIGGEGGGAPLSDATPAALGTAAAGAGTTASRDDHVHAMPTAAQVGAAARTATTPAFDTGQGWTIVAPSSGAANGSALTFPGSDIARITLSCNGSMDALTGPRAERAVTVTARNRWRASVVAASRSGTSGQPTAALYVRNSAADQFVCISASASANPSNVYAISQAGLLDPTPLAGSCPWDGTTALEIRYTDAGLLAFGVLASDGRFRPVATSAANAVLEFVPSHVGICGKAGQASAAVLDLSDFSFEVME